MKAMTDREVGELWLWLNLKPSDPNDPHDCSNKEALLLIHKLVKERARAHFYVTGYGPTPDASFKEWTECMSLALHNFGIDPREWKEA